MNSRQVTFYLAMACLLGNLALRDESLGESLGLPLSVLTLVFLGINGYLGLRHWKEIRRASRANHERLRREIELHSKQVAQSPENPRFGAHAK